MKPPQTVTLTPGKRVLFLTKDPDLIRKQLAGELDLQMKDLRVEIRVTVLGVAAFFAII